MGVRYVLLTMAQLDYSARAEAALVGGARSPLEPVFRTSELTVYELRAATPIITGAGSARVRRMDESSKEIYDRVAFLLDEVDARLDEGHADEGLEPVASR